MKKNAETTMRALLAPLALGLLIPIVAGWSGCKKEEPPPPLPSAAPASTPSAPLELAIEDAGSDEDADAEAGPKKTGPYKPAASLKACCSALAQNAASAPPPTNMYMMQAAAACNAAVAQGKDKGSVVSIVRGALKGAGMPAACN